MADLIHLTLSPSPTRELEDQPSPAKKFLEEQPMVKTEDLDENSQVCHICKELFDDPVVDESREFAIKLPCHHIMGSECLKTWFQGSNTCPMCRSTLFRTVSSADRLRATNVRVATLPYEEQAEVLSSFSADLESELLEIRTLSAENNEHRPRLAELLAAPGTGQNRAEIYRVMSRLREIDAQLEQVEFRLRGMGSLLRDHR